MRKLVVSGLALTALGAGCANIASAAEMAVPRVSAVAPAVPRWDGLYASFSAGASWTKGDFLGNSTSSTTDISTGTSTDPFFPFSSTTIINSTSNQNVSANGRDAGAVFTFGMGYNVLFGRWLVGVQSEVSRNLTDVTLRGTSSNTGTSVSESTVTFGGQVFGPERSSTTSANTSAAEGALANAWTISEMARIGFLLSPTTLTYGLIGWSYGRFNAGSSFAGDESNFGNGFAFNLNGLTYGGGIEQDFGWLRGFVQVKVIDYQSKTVNRPISSISTSQTNSLGFVQTTRTTTTGTETGRLSVHDLTVTAGITVPINFPSRLY